MFAVIWEYEVNAGAEAAFEALYGAEGAWVALFREYDGYVGTELLRREDGPLPERPPLERPPLQRRYLTIDRWVSAAAYEAFLTAAKPRYAQIDAQGDALTSAEHRIGRFQACVPQSCAPQSC
jgi:heme-degrading monooxygenase HmoA